MSERIAWDHPIDDLGECDAKLFVGLHEDGSKMMVPCRRKVVAGARCSYHRAIAIVTTCVKCGKRPVFIKIAGLCSGCYSTASAKRCRARKRGVGQPKIERMRK